MNKLVILSIFLVLSVFVFGTVHALSSIPVTSSTSSGGSLLGPLNQGNSLPYAAFFSIVVFIFFAVAFDRTELSPGGIAISFMLGVMTFFVLYSNLTLLHFFVNTYLILILIGLVIGPLALVKSPRSIRLVGLVVVIFLVNILFANDTGLANFIDSILHINILSIMPLVLGGISVIVIIMLLLRAIRNHQNPILRVALAFVTFLFITLLIPGFASFLFSPIILVPLASVIALVLFIMLKRPRVKRTQAEKDSIRAQKRDAKAQKLQPKVLSSINERKAANANVLKEYQDLIHKISLTPNEQFRVAQLKNKLANEAWKNVADRTKLTRFQYTKEQLANNKDLQKLTSSLFKGQAMHDLRAKAKSSYKMSRAERKELKQRQKFVKRAGASEAGDLLDMAKAAKEGAFGNVPSDKEARRMYEQKVSKEGRNKDVAGLLQDRQKIQDDPNLNLSRSSRAKLIKKLDKKLNKLTNNKIVPKSSEQKNEEILRRQQERLSNLSEDPFIQKILFQRHLFMQQERISNLSEDQRNLFAKKFADQLRQEQLRKETEQKNEGILLRRRLRQEQLREDNKLTKEINEELSKQNVDNKETSAKGKKQNLFAMFSSKAGRGGTGRRDIIQIGEKNQQASDQAGADIYNAKRVAGVFSTQEERELQSLLENAYANPDGKKAQRQIDEIKKVQNLIIGNKDKTIARKELEELKKRL